MKIKKNNLEINGVLNLRTLLTFTGPKIRIKTDEALESVICDVIKIQLKWRDSTRSIINKSSI